MQLVPQSALQILKQTPSIYLLLAISLHLPQTLAAPQPQPTVQCFPSVSYPGPDKGDCAEARNYLVRQLRVAEAYKLKYICPRDIHEYVESATPLPEPKTVRSCTVSLGLEAASTPDNPGCIRLDSDQVGSALNLVMRSCIGNHAHAGGNWTFGEPRWGIATVAESLRVV